MSGEKSSERSNWNLSEPSDGEPRPSRYELALENPDLSDEQRRSLELRHSPSGPSARIVNPPALLGPSHVAPARIRIPFDEADALVPGADTHAYYGAGIRAAQVARKWGYELIRVAEIEIDRQADEYLLHTEVMGRV